MNKTEFIQALSEQLSHLPQGDLEERIVFYEEMIDDRIEEGIAEEEAVAAVGPVDEIAAQIMSEAPLTKLVADKVKPKRKLSGWEIALLILCSPIWLTLALTALILLLFLYLLAWVLVFSVYALEVGLAAGAVFSIPTAWQYLSINKIAGAVFALGLCAVFVGLAIFTFYGSIAATKGVFHLTRRIFTWRKVA